MSSYTAAKRETLSFVCFRSLPEGTPQHGWFIRLVARSPDSWMSYLHTPRWLSVSTMLEKQVERLFIRAKWLMGKITHNEMTTQNATTAIFTLWKDISDTGEFLKGALLCIITHVLNITPAHSVSDGSQASLCSPVSIIFAWNSKYCFNSCQRNIFKWLERI